MQELTFAAREWWGFSNRFQSCFCVGAKQPSPKLSSSCSSGGASGRSHLHMRTLQWAPHLQIYVAHARTASEFKYATPFQPIRLLNLSSNPIRDGGIAYLKYLVGDNALNRKMCVTWNMHDQYLFWLGSTQILNFNFVLTPVSPSFGISLAPLLIAAYERRWSRNDEEEDASYWNYPCCMVIFVALMMLNGDKNADD